MSQRHPSLTHHLIGFLMSPCPPASRAYSSLSGMSARLPNTLLKRLVTLMDLKRAQWALSEESRSRRDRPARPSPPRYTERWNAYVGHSLS